MGHCPFCATKIPENTLLYGGSCPKCFGEIPGEEAATDPGAIVRAKQASSDSRRALFRTLVPLLFVVPMLGLLVIVALGFVFINRDPVLEPLVFDDVDDITYEIVAAPDDPPPEQVASNQPRPPGPKVTKTPRPIAGGTSTQAPKPTPAPKKTGLAGLGSALDDATAIQREGTEVCDPGQISSMVRNELRLKGPTLASCYQEARKRKPDLQGRWRANFVIQKSGFANGITFKGRTMSDPVMEACLAKKVATWHFGKICSTQEVNKTWKFQ